MVQQAGAARLGEELGAEADQAAGGHEVVHPHPAGAVVDHLLQAPLAQREQLGDDADVVLGHVDGETLDRLVHAAVDLARDHLRLADRELEALAAHQLDEHRQLQLAAALDLPRVGALGVAHPQRDVADQLLVEPRRGPGARSAWCPRCPASGEVLMPMVIDSDGSSTVITGSGRGSSGSASVSPIVTSARPATAMISPGPASSASTRSSASVT